MSGCNYTILYHFTFSSLVLELRVYDACLEECRLSLSHFVGLIQNVSDKTQDQRKNII